MIHVVHISQWLYFRSEPRSAKPGNVQSNWTGMTSYRADYCHSSSGNGSSTGDRLCPMCGACLRVQPLGSWGGRAAVPAGKGCSGVSQRTGTHFS